MISTSYLAGLTPAQSLCMLTPSEITCPNGGMTCSDFVANSPSFVFTIDGEKYTVPAQAYLLDYVDSTGTTTFNSCYPAIDV